MKILYTILASVLLIFAFHSTSVAQSVNIIESFKKHFNETVQEVHKTDNADKKREYLNKSFKKMISVLNRIESQTSPDEDEKANLSTYKSDLTEKQNQLNGLNGFDKIMDDELDGFALFSQDMIDQANLTITMGVGTAFLVNMTLRGL